MTDSLPVVHFWVSDHYTHTFLCTPMHESVRDPKSILDINLVLNGWEVIQARNGKVVGDNLQAGHKMPPVIIKIHLVSSYL